MDSAGRQLVSTLTYGLFQIPCSLFLLTIIVPLYKVAANRTALFILFSKTCFNVANQLSLAIYQPLNIYARSMLGPVQDWYPPIGQCLYQIIYMHILALALNRFIAIFLPIHYKRLFKKKRTFTYIFIVCIFGIILGISVILQGSLGNLNSIVQGTVLICSTLFYGAMLIKMGYGKFFLSQKNNAANGGVEKDRILLFCICLLSLLPLLLAQGIRQGLMLTPLGSPIWMCFSISQIANITAIQLIEECCLIIFCKDFRMQISKQYPCLFGQSNEENITNSFVHSIVNKQNEFESVNKTMMRLRTVTA